MQWGALEAAVLGMFYSHPEQEDAIEFSGDVNNFVSAHRYRVYSPTDDLLKLILNALLPKEGRLAIGSLRMTECRLPLPGKSLPDIEVFVSADDFKGTRTALFGKTRLGKSNIVKLVAESIIVSTEKSALTPESKTVGQLIFDPDGEYANDNPQDGNASLASAYRHRCTVYAITQKEKTPSKPLKLDFYAQPQSGLKILATLLRETGRSVGAYVDSFLAVDLPDVSTIAGLPINEQTRARRKILMYWAILHRAGYPSDLQKLTGLLRDVDPGFSQAVRTTIYQGQTLPMPASITTLDQLVRELDLATVANRQSPRTSSSSGSSLFDADDIALLGMLRPVGVSSSGPTLLRSFMMYHSAKAGDFVKEIVASLDKGETIILDLGNAAPELMSYFSSHLSRAIFQHQVEKFSADRLGSHFTQMYFEEAHNLFPSHGTLKDDIYQRLAKEGAKFHIGMVYSTQSVTTIDRDLLGQTENFFIVHMSSQDEVKALSKVNMAFDGLEQDILATRTPGYARMLTRSHRFVVPVQARRFVLPQKEADAANDGPAARP